MESVLGLAGKLAVELISPVFKKHIAEPWAHGSEEEFEKLKKTMFAINAVLLDAEERQQTNNQIQHWLREIKLVYYDVEDLLQEVTTKALMDQAKTRQRKRGVKEVLSSYSRPNTPVVRLNMGRKVKSIREKLDAIFSKSKIFNFTQRDKSRSKKREETHSLVPVERFIGRKDDKKYVIKLLTESEVVDNVSVVSLVGIGGMGKTTLAQSVYNSEEIKRKFQLMMWVCVSDPFDVKLICENIIMSVTSYRCDRLPLEIVKEKLKSFIDGRKYLLVLDDVWNDKQMEWEKLEVLLAGGARGSRILITARAKLVADAAKSIATHVLKGFSPEESWVLFKQIAFKQGVEQVSPTMEGIGKEVLVKCAGVPLVIKAMGSILALKEREIDWLDFKKYDLPRVSQNSEGIVLPILRFSYDYLSAPLKRCFVYCAIYPKDHEIEKEELIGMWVAHGLIQLDGTRRSLEDVGERHFMNLLSRSFFEVHQSWRGTRYKMHDLIHDLAQSVGGDEYYKHGSGAKCIAKSIRHAWVSGYELTNIGDDGQKLHTLVVTDTYDKEEFKNELTSSTFQQLRVLRMRSLLLKSVPQFVGGLRHLYYLDLSDNKFVSLPESICSLYNLQTLILSGCGYLEELPAGIRDLGSLRRLDISDCASLRYMPRGLEELTCLQTLSDFVCREEGCQRRNYAEVCELKSLANLRGSLEIRNLRGSLADAKCEEKRSCILVERELITQLKLSWKDHYEYQYGKELKEEEEEAELLLFESLRPHPNLERLIIEDYPGKKYPSWMDRVNIGVSFPNIVYIQLYACRSLRHVAALGLLPSLQELYLEENEGVEYLIDISSSTVEEEAEEPLFPSLKELHLTRMDELERVVEPTESSGNKRYFPVLEKLVIDQCPFFLAYGSSEDGKLFASHLELSFSGAKSHGHDSMDIETIPCGLQYLPHLQILTISDCTKIVSLPDWMGNLTSLQELRLVRLYSLASIPNCLQSLTSLQRLLIENCTKLVRRYEKETGADWYKIAHIPDITIDDEFYPSDSESDESEDSSSLGEESKHQNEEHELSGGPKLRHMPRGLEEPTCLQTMNTFVTGGSGDEGGKRKCAEVCDLESQVSVIHTLDLSYTNIKSLPEFISEYVAVRELKLKGCQLLMELGPEIGEFLNLQELDLEDTEIICLPKEIAKLINLKSLKFTLCGYADQFQETKQIASVIPQKALSNILQLNELCIDVNPLGDWWNAEVKAVIDDLHCLQELKILRLYIPTVDLFGYMIQRIKLLIDQDSVCFRFTVGHHERLVSRLPDGVLKEFDDLEKFKKGLKFTSGEGMSIEITNALQHMDAFLLERHWSINNLLEFGQKSTKKLKCCILSECNKLQTLIDTKQPPDYDGTVLGSLQHLSIHYMKNMQKIWRGPVKKGSLSNLKSLALYTCVSLATVFKIDMLANLTNLEELRIEDCPKIKTLASSNFSDSMSQDFLPKLKSMLLLELPNLRCISSGLPIAPKLERLVILFCPNLKKLSTTEISSKDLQVLKGTKGWWDALKWYESDVTEADQNYLTSKFIPLREDGDLEEQFLRD